MFRYIGIRFSAVTNVHGLYPLRMPSHHQGKLNRRELELGFCIRTKIHDCRHVRRQVTCRVRNSWEVCTMLEDVIGPTIVLFVKLIPLTPMSRARAHNNRERWEGWR